MSAVVMLERSRDKLAPSPMTCHSPSAPIVHSVLSNCVGTSEPLFWPGTSPVPAATMVWSSAAMNPTDMLRPASSKWSSDSSFHVFPASALL